MATRISRRILSRHVASRLLEGDAGVVPQLAAYLVETRRTNEAELIVRSIEDSLREAGVIVADIISAHELSEELSKLLSTQISGMTDAQEVHLRLNTNPALLGGVRIRIPGAEYDATLRRKLIKLQALKV